MNAEDRAVFYAAVAREKYVAERTQFRSALNAYGAAHYQANYCISVARRLRKIYAQSERVTELEDEALTALRNMLDKLPALREYDTEASVPWQCIPGGLHEGDETLLYIVPPNGQPVPVPIPPDLTEDGKDWYSFESFESFGARTQETATPQKLRRDQERREFYDQMNERRAQYEREMRAQMEQALRGIRFDEQSHSGYKRFQEIDEQRKRSAKYRK